MEGPGPMRIWVALALLGAMLAYGGGCAVTTSLLGLGKERPSAEVAECGPEREQRPLARGTAIRGSLRLQRGTTATAQRFRLTAPVAVAAQGSDVLIADAAESALFRYDRGTQTIRLFARVPGLGARAQLFVDRALSAYLAAPSLGAVLQFDLDGRPVRRYEDAVNLSRPVAVVVDDVRAEVFAADELSGAILVFSRNGGVVRALGTRTGAEPLFRKIAGVALETDQLYVADSGARQVVALSPTGLVRYTFGSDELKAPGPLAVDAHHRVFVADTMDNVIHVYRGGQYVTTVGAQGDPSGIEFGMIAALWASEGLLYVADSIQGSVQILRILPPCEA